MAAHSQSIFEPNPNNLLGPSYQPLTKPTPMKKILLTLAVISAFGYSRADDIATPWQNPDFQIPASYSNEQLEVVAQKQALFIYNCHDDPTKIQVDRIAFHNMGLAIALRHGLTGMRADWFAMNLADAYEALVVGY
jgi:hypothetical protein